MMTEGDIAVATQDGAGRETRANLLDAAERLFAERGIAAVSLRLITASVGANVAAVHYHFGPKERLIEEVFARRARTIVDERLRRLAIARAEPDRERRVEALIAAFLEPGFFGAAGSPEGMALFAKFRARLVTEASETARALLATYLNDSSRQFLDAFAEALPHLPRTEVEWRFHALLSVMVYTMANPGRIQSLTDGDCDPADLGAAITHLVPALAGMFRAPAGTGPAGRHR